MKRPHFDLRNEQLKWKKLENFQKKILLQNDMPFPVPEKVGFTQCGLGQRGVNLWRIPGPRNARVVQRGQRDQFIG